MQNKHIKIFANHGKIFEHSKINIYTKDKTYEKVVTINTLIIKKGHWWVTEWFLYLPKFSKFLIRRTQYILLKKQPLNQKEILVYKIKNQLSLITSRTLKYKRYLTCFSWLQKLEQRGMGRDDKENTFFSSKGWSINSNISCQGLNVSLRD